MVVAWFRMVILRHDHGLDSVDDPSSHSRVTFGRIPNAPLEQSDFVRLLPGGARPRSVWFLGRMERRGDLKKGSVTARTLGSFIAFAQSGLILGAGSYPALRNMKPWYAFLFFVLAGWLAWMLRDYTQLMPRWIRGLSNVVTFWWLYLVGSLFLDDFIPAYSFLIPQVV